MSSHDSPVRIHLHQSTTHLALRPSESLTGTVYFPASVEHSGPVNVTINGFVQCSAHLPDWKQRTVSKVKGKITERVPGKAKEGVKKVGGKLSKDSQDGEGKGHGLTPSSAFESSSTHHLLSHHHSNPNSSTLIRSTFTSTALKVTPSESTKSEVSIGSEFKLELPSSTITLDGSSIQIPAPPSCDGIVVWGVEAVVDGKVVAIQGFQFLPSPSSPDESKSEEEKKEEGDAPELEQEKEETTEREESAEKIQVTSSMKLSSNLQVPWGTLTSVISIPKPLTYPRTTGVIPFALSLSHAAPTGPIGKTKDVLLYSCIVELVQRTILMGTGKRRAEADEGLTNEEKSGDDDWEEVIRAQTIGLSMEISPSAEPREFSGLLFDLQAPSSGDSVGKIPPSFVTPNVKREYYLRFILNPAHNHRREVARIRITILPEPEPKSTTGEEEMVDMVKQLGLKEMKDGVPVM
ncbi:hypothetical protein T439DRAFT_325672 [Meredithblackwellia eburnea MCA 4105]